MESNNDAFKKAINTVKNSVGAKETGITEEEMARKLDIPWPQWQASC
jgi:hypothetical protein